MFDAFNDGFCPQCLLAEKHLSMVNNAADYWECPECHLQARADGWSFTILRVRGRGHLRDIRAVGRVHGQFLCGATDDSVWPHPKRLSDESELREFLAYQVKPAQTENDASTAPGFPPH